MQEVFEKIIELLTQKENEAVLKAPNTGDIANAEYQKWMMKSYGFKEAIEIVKQEAEKYNDNWIPCNERMPEESESIFAKYKGTEKWKDNMFEKMSDEVNVTIEKEDGKRLTMYAHTVDGKWKNDMLRVYETWRVIAWQPLQQPYQPKGE